MKYKDVEFYEDRIVLNLKNDKITISKYDIKDLVYVKPTLINFFLVSGFFPGGTFPGQLLIRLNKKIGKTQLYFISIKYKEVINLPEYYLNKIDPSNLLGWKK